MSIIIIEDERHAEWQGRFQSLKEAISELRVRAGIPWDQAPNVAPCTNWKNCGRTYEIVEFDDNAIPWREIRRYPVLDISASGVSWYDNLQDLEAE